MRRRSRFNIIIWALAGIATFGVLSYHLQVTHVVSRPKIVPPGEAKPLFCDLGEATANTLVEAKGSVSRQAIRMALGQLADYRRFADPDVKPAVLVPESPRPDLLALLEAEGVAAIWPVNDGFTDTDGGTFT